MKYSWAKANEKFRNLLWANLQVDNKECAYFVGRMLLATDQFHPIDGDYEMQRALNKMPKYCNYRSIKSYWAFKEGKELIGDALFLMFEEIFERITEYMRTPYNFGPGDFIPCKITARVPWEDYITPKMISAFIKASKMP